MFKSRINPHRFMLLVILGIALFFRLYNFPLRIGLGADSSRDAYVSLEGARTLQLPLTGPFASIAPITTTPWYWIQLIIGRLVLPTPYAPWLVVAIYSTLTVLVMYKIGSLLENKTFGLITALLAALSPQLISDAVGLNNHAVVPFFSSLSVLFYILLLKRGPNFFSGLLFGLVLGTTITSHYQTAGFLVLPLTLFYFRKRYLKTLLATAIGIVVMLLPLLVFELTNHWFNTRHVLQYLLVDQYKIWVSKRWLTYITNFWPDYITFALGGYKISSLVLALASFTILSINFYKRKLNSAYIFLAVSFAVQIVLIRYYRGEMFFGYNKFVLPFLYIFIGYVFYQIIKVRKLAFLGSVCLAGFVLIVIPVNLRNLAPEGRNVETFNFYQELKQKLGNGPFKILKCNHTNKDDIEALALVLLMQGDYSKQGIPIAYHYGCGYPSVRVNGQEIKGNTLTTDIERNKLFPKINWALEDFSEATAGAMLDAGWTTITPESMYQKIARWWMDEQP